VRAWSFDEAERIDAAFFERRVAQAVAMRARLPIASDGVRLVHGEADGLPGLIVDRYGDTLSAQFLSAGTERWKRRARRPAAGRHRLHAPVRAQDSSVRGARRPGAAHRLAARRRRPPRSRSASTPGA
jgi:23S rRNA (cytosine1962-C5)-methyltransferase